MNLRLTEPSDLDTLYLWYNDPRQWHNALSQPMVSRHHLHDYLNNSTHTLADGQLCLVAEVDGQPAGTVDFCDYNARNGTAWVSIYLAEKYRGKGLGTEMLEQALQYADEGLCLRSLAAMVLEDNPASLRLFLSAGFFTCGRMPGWVKKGGEVLDVIVLQRR